MKLKLGKLLAVSLVALSLASCAGEPAGGDAGDKTQANESFVDVTDQQGTIEGFVGASDDAEVTRCEADGNGWVSEGSVTNPTDEEQSYRVYVAFNKNRDTKGLVQVDVESVEAGRAADWKAEAPVNAEKLDCVLRVERFTPQD